MYSSQALQTNPQCAPELPKSTTDFRLALDENDPRRHRRAEKVSRENNAARQGDGPP